MSPLHYAAQKGHNNIVEYLINHKADANAISYYFEFKYLSLYILLIVIRVL